MSGVRRRSMHDIRTMGDRVSDAEKPQRRFLRVAILELEKVRRTKEKQRAHQRVQDLEQRLAEIQGEQTELLGGVELPRQDQRSPTTPSPPPETPNAGDGAAFRITY